MQRFTCDDDKRPTQEGNQNRGVLTRRGCQLQGKTDAHSYQGQERHSEEEEACVRAAGFGPHGQHTLNTVTDSRQQQPLPERPGVMFEGHQIQDMEDI